MADNDITIAIKTTADTTGAQQTTESLKGVESEVKILDSNQKMSLKERKDSEAAFTAWQAEQMAKRKGTTSALATEIVTAEEAAATAARRAANQATIAAAEQEAAAVKAAQASATKAAAEQAAAVKIEAALAKETAAAEAQAIADQAIGEKKIINAAIRAATPRNRQLSAAMSVANSPQAMAMLTNPYVLATLAVVTLGIVASKTFGNIKSDMDTATMAGSKFEEQNKKTAAAISAMAHPMNAAWEGIKSGADRVATAFSHLMSDAIELGGDIKGCFDGGALAAEIASMREMAAGERVAKKASEEYANIATAHASMTTQILANEAKVHAAEDDLAKGREQRSGMDAGQVAANEMARFVAKTAADDAMMVAQLEVLKTAHRNKLFEALHAGSEEERDTLNAEANKQLVEIAKVTAEIAAKRKAATLETTNKLESTEAEVKANLNEKIMANATKLQEDLQGLVDKGSSAPATIQALAQINALVDSGKVSADQLKTVIAGFGHSMDATTADQRKFLGDISKSDEEAVSAAKSLDAEITKLTQNQAAVTTAVADTASAQQTHHAETVTAIATLAPTPADKQAVVTAVQDTGKAISDKDNAIIEALTSIQTGIAGVTRQIENQQRQIDNLFSRIR